MERVDLLAAVQAVVAAELEHTEEGWMVVVAAGMPGSWVASERLAESEYTNSLVVAVVELVALGYFKTGWV